jgi:predicted acylesterase/phospholipase RssA
MSTRDPGVPSVVAPDLDYDPSGGAPEVGVQMETAARPEPARPTGPPRGPLGNLAVSLSGGGYRAAGFHLGVLRLLDRVGLLPSVAALSTVSGGTIVGASWVVSLAEKTPFADFYRAFSGFLRRTNVIGAALKHLTSTRGSGLPPSLIRSAAAVYADPGFMGDRRFREVMDAPGLPLDEVIFNSTEFHTGVDFRFRHSANPDAVIGNGNFPVNPEVAANTRLADVVAASSCFPSAFEPFVFPDHFAWPATFPLASVRDALGERFAGGLPLMDGGIFDNQGVDALLLAYRKAADPPVLLICDTSPPQEQLYTYPAGRARGWLTLTRVNLLAWVALALAAASAVGLLRNVWGDPDRFSLRGVVLYWFPIATSAVVAAGLVWLRLQVKRVREILKSDARIENAWDSLRGLTVSELITLVQLRVTSLVALTSSVFMKRVRGLIFSGVFADTRYADRRIPNLIYSLTLSWPSLFGRNPWLRPGDRLRELADRASEVPTALWLDSDDQLTLLADVGEATTCFTLLKHILELPAARQAEPEVRALFDRLRQIWDGLNTPSA